MVLLWQSLGDKVAGPRRNCVSPNHLADSLINAINRRMRERSQTSDDDDDDELSESLGRLHLVLNLPCCEISNLGPISRPAGLLLHTAADREEQMKK